MSSFVFVCVFFVFIKKCYISELAKKLSADAERVSKALFCHSRYFIGFELQFVFGGL